MKNLLIGAAASLALAIPAAGFAADYPTGTGPGGVVNTQNPDGFKNKGQCQAALSKEINRQRMDATARTASRADESTSTFQKNMLDRFSCQLDAQDGVYRVYVNGG